jgi:hypothetical protein
MLRLRFSPEERDEKARLLEGLSRTEIREPRLLFRYHETLLFLRAYPDDGRILALSRAECDRFAARVVALRRRSRLAANRLDESGIAGTVTRHPYDLVTARKLLGWYGDTLDIDWDEFEETERLDTVLPLIAQWMENDGLDLAEVTTEEWVEQARGDSGRSGLRWLIDSLSALPASHPIGRHLFDSMEIPVAWRLEDSDASRTNAAHTHRRPFFHDGPLRRKVEDLRREIARPMPALETATRREATGLIRLVTTALAVRHRALYPIEYPNPEDVLIAEPGRGYRIVLFGMLPEYRLPIESDYGALLLKNGYPIGYGIGALLFDQVEIAVNIFDTWRGGEAGYLFAQFARAFRSHFGCSRFKIVKYQIGHENDEGLKSGSFWFYYKLGFRPADSRVGRLAEKERAKIEKDPLYRTSIAVLRKLATSDLFYSLGGPREATRDFPLADLGMGTTRWIGKRFGGDRRKASRECAARAGEILSSPDWKKWPRPEREWFRRFSPLVCRIAETERWPIEARRDLAAIMRSKGKASEVEFARRMAGATRLRAALERLARERN